MSAEPASYALRVLIAGRPPARRQLLAQLRALAGAPPWRAEPVAPVLADIEAALAGAGADLLLLDADPAGVASAALAEALAVRADCPDLVLVAASDSVAARACESAVAAGRVRCLRRPAGLPALRAALDAAWTRQTAPRALPSPAAFLAVDDGRDARAVPWRDILYLRADAKYVMVRTRARAFLSAHSLIRLAREAPVPLVRVHRAALVAPAAVAGARRVPIEERAPDALPYWELCFEGIADRLAVSRRQWPRIAPLLEQAERQQAAPASMDGEADAPLAGHGEAGGARWTK